MNKVLLGLGSNKEDRLFYIEKSIHLLGNYFIVTNRSETIETLPDGTIGDNFLNKVVEISTLFSPFTVMEKTKYIEKKLNRERFKKWSPRTIDIDILLYNDLIINTPLLTIPHPLMHKRYFVLKPLCDICPTLIHPVLKTRCVDLLNELIFKQ
jgi:2-amino-4-hydroxy-6-hydroxymethyldihydropteridine diphosphokinase